MLQPQVQTPASDTGVDEVAMTASSLLIQKEPIHFCLWGHQENEGGQTTLGSGFSKLNMFLFSLLVCVCVCVCPVDKL